MKLRLILLAGIAGFLGFAVPAPDRVVSSRLPCRRDG